MRTEMKLSVSGLVLRNSEVLLVRHTYGPAKGKLVIPGGHVEEAELPAQTVRREVLEVTQVQAAAERLLAVRFRPADWWVIFALHHVSGTPAADNREIDLALFLGIQDAIDHPDITDTTRYLLERYISSDARLFSPCDFRPALHSGEQWILYAP